MNDYELFRSEIGDAIEGSLQYDEQDDEYGLDIEDAVEAVIDVLEKRHMLIFTSEN